jgi:PAS domain S-box-containing protein
MNRWRSSSLEGRLIRLILIASTLALMCVMVGVVVYESTSFQPRALAQLRQPAEILKELLQPALDFDAREDVDRYLKKYCESQPNPVIAVVYDAEGRLFASYPPNLTSAPNSPEPPGYKFSAGELVIWRQLERQSVTLGHLYLREQLPPLYIRLAQYSLMLATLLTSLLIVASTLLIGARRDILRPLAGLVKTTERIAQNNDYTVRSELQQDDEVGHLARTFNRMLDVISASDSRLRESEASLASDLKERKRVETKLIESEQRYRALFENMSAGFVLFEVVQNEEGVPVDLVILAANEGFEATTELQQEEFTGHRLTHVLPGIEKDGADWIGTFGKVALSGEQQQFEQGSELLGYVYAITAYQAGPKQCAVIFSDITERKRAEELLRRSEAELKAITDHAPAMVALVDRDAKMLYLNRPPEGMDAADFIGLSIFDTAPPGYEAVIRAAHDKVCATEEPEIFRVEFPVKNSLTAKRQILEAHTGPVFVGGEMVGVVHVAIDVTEQTLLNEKLQTHREQLQQLNQKLETRVALRTAELEASNKELEAFNYSVSHDLRAPLRHVAGFIELLKRQGYANADEKSQHYMDVISASAVQMGNMVDDILTFSRLGRTEMRMTCVSLDELVKAAITILQPEIAGRDIQWNISPLPSVQGEREMLQRVMTNLIGNALKYSRSKPVAVIEIGVQTYVDEHILYIKDNGVGFDMRYIDKLFGVFQRLHRADEFEGTGIGLANVQRIIHRHGGRVWADGKVGEGASFYVSLPVLQPSQKALQ